MTAPETTALAMHFSNSALAIEYIVGAEEVHTDLLDDLDSGMNCGTTALGLDNPCLPWGTKQNYAGQADHAYATLLSHEKNKNLQPKPV